MLTEILYALAKFHEHCEDTEKIVGPLVHKGFQMYYKGKDVYDIFYKRYYKEDIKAVLEKYPGSAKTVCVPRDAFIKAYNETSLAYSLARLSFVGTDKAKDKINAIENAVLRNHEEEYGKLYEAKELETLLKLIGVWYGEALYEVYMRRLEDFSIATEHCRIDGESCAGCGTCAIICPVSAISEQGGSYAVNADECILCETCISVCPAQAISKAYY